VYYPKKRWKAGRDILGIAGTTFQLHNGAQVVPTSGFEDVGFPLRVETPPQIWAYALEIPLTLTDPTDAPVTGPLLFEIDITVEQGSVGLAAATPGLGAFASAETFVTADAGPTKALVFAKEAQSCAALILRKVDNGKMPSVATLWGIRCAKAKDAWAEPALGPSAADPGATDVPLSELAAILGLGDTEQTEPAEAGAMIWRAFDASDRLPIIEADRLGAHLGFAEPFALAERLLEHPLTQWRMERDDALILSYLYAQHAPRRHLEFGTWEGFGAVLCAQSCGAEIWTINLPDGESTADGSAVYAQPVAAGTELPPSTPTFANSSGALYVQTDRGERIGWRYRAAGLENRVHQLLCDSTEWDTSGYPPEFFDSVLIDGGHQVNVVVNDTDKSLPLLRPGGLCIWHDFCPNPEALESSPAGLGVSEAIIKNWARWRPEFSDIFWIRPSWILLGVKRR